MPIRLHLLGDMAIAFLSGHAGFLHRHAAVQITVALDAPFSVRLRGVPAQPERRFVCFPPHCEHAIDPGEGLLAYLYLDCGHRGWLQWQARHGPPRIVDDVIVDALRREAGAVDASSERIAVIAALWREHCLPGLEPLLPEDDRIRRAVERIDRDPVDAGNYAALARAVHLSPSRFASLFREHVGMPVRNYVLWRRLHLALHLWTAGARVTDAAVDAGFSDCAHLSRSFRHVFGAAPTELETAAALQRTAARRETLNYQIRSAR